MSKSRTGTSGPGQAGDSSRHERNKDEFQAATGYQPSTNQARDEPLPASHDDDGRQEASRRRGEPPRDQPNPSDETGRSDTGKRK